MRTAQGAFVASYVILWLDRKRMRMHRNDDILKEYDKRLRASRSYQSPKEESVLIQSPTPYEICTALREVAAAAGHHLSGNQARKLTRRILEGEFDSFGIARMDPGWRLDPTGVEAVTNVLLANICP